MISDSALTSLAGKTMHGTGGEKIGKIVDVYESTDGAEGTFVTVSTGLFGSHASFVPLAEADLQGNDVVVPYDKALVKDAPRVDTDEELTSQEEDRLYAHYGLGSGTSTTTTSTAGTTGLAAGATGIAAGATTGRRDADGDGVYDDVERTAVGYDTSGPTTDDAMTRSEERLQVGVQRTEAGRARLRKRIITETETRTVPVTHDELRIEREPITDGNATAAYDGPALSEEEHEVVLRAEKPVVAKETVPVERVRLDVDTVAEQVTVTEEVRKEQIDLDSDVETTRDSGLRR